MKKRILGAVIALFVAGSINAQETAISQSQLPASVKRNISKYFGNKTISTVVKDMENGKVVYDVYFEDQSEAEFASNGTLKEAKSHAGLPNSVIPASIQSYVKRNYPNTTIVKWDKGWNKQEIELSNGLDLDFDLRGRFLRVDD